ncbi:MAG: hypothetical protein PHD58_00895 [Anaerolineales bacterium]|nr:hypothetical protein [Anaerolineales bacterium]
MQSIFSGRRAVIVSIALLTAVLHIVGIGRHVQRELFNLYYSYFSDLLLPFTFYFLFCLPTPELALLRRWEVRLALTFLLPSIAETSQYFGIPVLGETFDPLDYVMYACGALLAALVETQVFARVFRFWRIAEAGG